QVIQTSFVDKEELLNKGRLFGKLHLEPGCGIGEHVHEGEEEIFYIAKGEVVYNDDGVEHVLKEGDITICKADHSHFVTNKSDQPADLIALILTQ
ncbi:MAG: cupin domain-containing protein, partial [Erysipelotrichaceae bacterium]|nr:cupin domain-containing protein [Erysipelotrichaceae bacterium]